MYLELATLPPFSETQFLVTPKNNVIKQSFFEYFFKGKKLDVIQIPIVDYNEFTGGVNYTSLATNEKVKHTGSYFIKNQTFWLGTDRFGRDLLSRIIYGVRVSMAVGIIAVFISLIIGITLGLIAGFYRGRIDDIVMWFVNVIWSIPTLLMVIAITLALGKGFWQVFVAVGLTMWVEVARIVRGQVIAIRELEYIEASKVLAYSPFRIIIKHILPNVIGPVIVISAANFAAAILIEAGLSFLGIGAQPPIPSWGGIIKDHYSYIIMDKAYLAIVPGTAIMILVLSFMVLGNGLRDAFDVRN
jgi:peptide/nickel transport system permease protein